MHRRVHDEGDQWPAKEPSIAHCADGQRVASYPNRVPASKRPQPALAARAGWLSHCGLVIGSSRRGYEMPLPQRGRLVVPLILDPAEPGAWINQRRRGRRRS